MSDIAPLWCAKEALLHCGIWYVGPPGLRGPGAEGPATAAASAGADHVVVVGKDELEAWRMTLRDMSGGAQESKLIAEIKARLKAHFQDKFG